MQRGNFEDWNIYLTSNKIIKELIRSINMHLLLPKLTRSFYSKKKKMALPFYFFFFKSSSTLFFLSLNLNELIFSYSYTNGFPLDITKSLKKLSLIFSSIRAATIFKRTSSFRILLC